MSNQVILLKNYTDKSAPGSTHMSRATYCNGDLGRVVNYVKRTDADVYADLERYCGATVAKNVVAKLDMVVVPRARASKCKGLRQQARAYQQPTVLAIVRRVVVTGLQAPGAT